MDFFVHIITKTLLHGGLDSGSGSVLSAFNLHPETDKSGSALRFWAGLDPDPHETNEDPKHYIGTDVPLDAEKSWFSWTKRQKM